MPSPTEITVSQLSRLIGTPDAPIVLDVCIEEDFELDPRIIPTSHRCPHRDVENLLPALGDRRVVVYCQKGRKISQGAAAILRGHGVGAESLEGGHFAWRDAGEPLVPAAKIPRGGVPPVFRGQKNSPFLPQMASELLAKGEARKEHKKIVKPSKGIA